jgi:SAM-dependent methyltransferase
MSQVKHPASFRDPSGFIFVKDGTIFRQINQCSRESYDYLLNSGLHNVLVDQNLLIPHIEIDHIKGISDEVYKIIKPESIPFTSYPYEWTFSQLKDAALLTLRIQRLAIEYEMTLKDASAFNVQFWHGRPILIDTLSFEKYIEGSPWIAYRQYCQHFLAPLAVMKYCDIRLANLLKTYLDGLPLDLTSSILPLRSRFNFPLYCHIHLHAKYQRDFAGSDSTLKVKKINRLGMLGIIDSLESAIRGLKWQPSNHGWADYYDSNTYSQLAFNHKKKLVHDYLRKTQPKLVFDFGANTGEFSRLACDTGSETISFDVDPLSAEINYQKCVSEGQANILPLVLDLANPSSGLGWAHQERSSLAQRGPADMVLALALIHHLAFANNLPLILIADFLATLGKRLIIEFVPPEDAQCQRLVADRIELLSDYNQATFEEAFKRYFIISDMQKIEDSGRFIYFMKRN